MDMEINNSSKENPACLFIFRMSISSAPNAYEYCEI